MHFLISGLYFFNFLIKSFFLAANSNERIHSSHDSKVTEETPVEPMDVGSLPTSPTSQRNSRSQRDPPRKEEISQEEATNDGSHNSEKKDMETDQTISNTELDKNKENSEVLQSRLYKI